MTILRTFSRSTRVGNFGRWLGCNRNRGRQYIQAFRTAPGMFWVQLNFPQFSKGNPIRARLPANESVVFGSGVTYFRSLGRRPRVHSLSAKSVSQPFGPVAVEWTGQLITVSRSFTIRRGRRRSQPIESIKSETHLRVTTNAGTRNGTSSFLSPARDYLFCSWSSSSASSSLMRSEFLCSESAGGVITCAARCLFVGRDAIPN